MSNKQNTKRVLSIDEDLNPKKNKILEKSTSSIDFSGKAHNTPVHQMENFEISGGESIVKLVLATVFRFSAITNLKPELQPFSATAATTAAVGNFCNCWQLL